MAATKLSQYQAVARLLGDARLALITDDVETRYILDDAWDDATAFVLRQAAWRFALKQAALVVGGALVNGYTTSCSFPADWLRTQAVYLLGLGGRECPFDFRENGSAALSFNITGTVHMRYVSNVFLDPALWPAGHFSQLHAAYLAFMVAERVTGERAAAGRMSQLFASLLPEAVALDAMPEDPWLPHQRSGALLRVSLAMMDEGDWRFAMPAPVEITTTAGGAGGFTRVASIPNDWAHTRALYKVNAAGQKRPFDIRERGGLWLTNETAFWIEYVSSVLAMDSTKWPDHYMRAILRELEFDGATLGDEKDQETDGKISMGTLAATLSREAEPDDPWFMHQTSGRLARCIPAVMSKGFWRFAAKLVQLTSEVDQDASLSVGDYPYSFPFPADWFKTHAAYIAFSGAECPFDIREHEGHWSTATRFFMVRYISTAALDPAQWPDSVADAVMAYLDFETAPAAEKKNAAAIWGEALGAALKEWSLPEHVWLRFQFDGRYVDALEFVLAAVPWKFATKTVNLTADATVASDGTISGTPIASALGDGSISPSYSAIFNKPSDWYRTVWMYRLDPLGNPVNFGYPERTDIDFREEGGAWHTNYSPIQVRYLTQDGLDSTRSPASFRNAVLAWLRYDESQSPKDFKLYEETIARAKSENYSRERVPVNQVGQFVRGRFGSRMPYSDPIFVSVTSTSTGDVLTDDSGESFLTP